ncbi:MAG: hypothetical protein WCF10_03300, partial [Polyangiales bacterium]
GMVSALCLARAGANSPSIEILTGLGIEDDGALLIRPDRHVAWRHASLGSQPKESLLQALQSCWIQ